VKKLQIDRLFYGSCPSVAMRILVWLGTQRDRKQFVNVHGALPEAPKGFLFGLPFVYRFVSHR